MKRWKKLPADQNKTKQNCNHVVRTRAGRTQAKNYIETEESENYLWNRTRSNQISKRQKEFKCHSSGTHRATSSASPAQSPRSSNQSDDGSGTEMASGSQRMPVFLPFQISHTGVDRKYVAGLPVKAVLGKSSLTHICSSLPAAVRRQRLRSGGRRGQSLCPSPPRSGDWSLCRRGTQNDLHFRKILRQQNICSIFNLNTCSSAKRQLLD